MQKVVYVEDNVGTLTIQRLTHSRLTHSMYAKVRLGVEGTHLVLDVDNLLQWATPSYELSGLWSRFSIPWIRQ